MRLDKHDRLMMSKGYRYRMEFALRPEPLYTKTIGAMRELLKSYPESKHGPIKIRPLYSKPCGCVSIFLHPELD